MTSADSLVAANAVRTLGRMMSLVGDEELMRLLHDPRARVRSECVRALGESRDAAGTPFVMSALTETDPAIRALAIQALGKIGGSISMECLSALAADSSLSRVDRAFVLAALREARRDRQTEVIRRAV